MTGKIITYFDLISSLKSLSWESDEVSVLADQIFEVIVSARNPVLVALNCAFILLKVFHDENISSDMKYKYELTFVFVMDKFDIKFNVSKYRH
ncbi:hypothetical protein [Xenorhabdus sp. TS4]|uniref:hypothetical protein n=1 Tax=Xenorhabdus sp. TS4 TaxID=1873483 RepID=UPI001656DA62|nr:hypothetical protein [Xenorhabdus sp. TS4]